jgi:HSP20 family protein
VVEMNDIFEELLSMQERMDDVWQGYDTPLLAIGSEGRGLAKKDAPSGLWRNPRCSLCESEDSVHAEFELPGVDKKDIQLNVTDDGIEVKVEKKLEKEVEDKGRFSYERGMQSFYRHIPLAKRVESSLVKATYKDGVLTLEIPKKVSEKPKLVNID